MQLGALLVPRGAVEITVSIVSTESTVFTNEKMSDLAS